MGKGDGLRPVAAGWWARAAVGGGRLAGKGGPCAWAGRVHGRQEGAVSRSLRRSRLRSAATSARFAELPRPLHYGWFVPWSLQCGWFVPWSLQCGRGGSLVIVVRLPAGNRTAVPHEPVVPTHRLPPNRLPRCPTRQVSPEPTAPEPLLPMTRLLPRTDASEPRPRAALSSGFRRQAARLTVPRRRSSAERISRMIVSGRVDCVTRMYSQPASRNTRSRTISMSHWRGSVR